MEAFVDYWFDQANDPEAVSWWMLMDVHSGPGSATSEIDADATAYAHRDKLWLWQCSSPAQLDSPDMTPGIKFVNGFMDSLKDNMEDGSWGRYVNYIDSELTREEAVQQYWGTHVPKLELLKAQYDPTELFSNPQSIQPAKSS